MPLVADASVLLAWCYSDEDDDLAVRALEVSLAEGLVLPSIWEYEVANSLASSLRRGRVVADDISATFRLLSHVDRETVDLHLDDLLGPVLRLAASHNLSAYDASYLYLALRERVPLATLDSRLRAAAEAEGCTLFG